MRIVFMGTPVFAVTVLDTLHRAGHEIQLVVTQPDRPKGRGHKLAFSPVKERALTLGLQVAQPERAREPGFVEKIKALAPEAIVVVAFGQILPEEILAIPKYGCINLHASLLPKYRGAAPIHTAVLQGETVSGNTTMLMDKGMDTGDMLLTNKVAITPEMTTGQLHDLLATSGAQLVLETLQGLQQQTITPVKQDDSQASYAGKLDKEIEIIDWHKTSAEIYNKIRGLNPWPAAYTTLNGNRVKIFQARLAGSVQAEQYLPGQFVRQSDKGFFVATGDGLLEVLEVQPAGKKPMPAKNFIQGINAPGPEIILGRKIDDN